MSEELTGGNETESTAPAADSTTEIASEQESTVEAEVESQGSEEVQNTTDDGESAEGGDDAEVESLVPDEYAYNMPEGMTLNAEFAESVEPVFRDLGLNQEQADKLVGAYAEMQLQNQTKFNERVEGWATDLKNDPDFGGDNFEANANKVASFIDKTIPEDIKDDFKQVLNSSGIGNHPALVKYFSSLASQFPVEEDIPSSGRAPSNRGKSREERLYPDT